MTLLLGMATLILTIAGIVAGTFALLAKELDTNRPLKYSVVTVIAFLTLFAGTMSFYAFTNSPATTLPPVAPTAAVVENTISIEALSFRAMPYTAGAEADKASSSLTIHSGDSDIDYIFEYELPQDGDANVGLVFSFTKPEDLTRFNFIEVTIDFEEDISASFDLFLKDESLPWNVPGVRIGSNVIYSGNVSRNIDGNVHTIKTPLDTFEPMDFKAVKEIGFNIGAFSLGKHIFVVKDVRFLVQ